MKYEAVLDRIEDGKATILVESISKEFVMDAAKLPKGIVEGTWLDVEIVEEKVNVLQINEEKTEKQQTKATEHMKRLRSKSKGSKFQRRK